MYAYPLKFLVALLTGFEMAFLVYAHSSNVPIALPVAPSVGLLVVGLGALAVVARSLDTNVALLIALHLYSPNFHTLVAFVVSHFHYIPFRNSLLQDLLYFSLILVLFLVLQGQRGHPVLPFLEFINLEMKSTHVRSASLVKERLFIISKISTM